MTQSFAVPFSILILFISSFYSSCTPVQFKKEELLLQTSETIDFFWQEGVWSACNVNPLWSDFSNCSVTCGNGIQTRTCQNSEGFRDRSVVCRSTNGSVVDSSYCSKIPKPEISEACHGICPGENTQSCSLSQSCTPAVTYQWNVGQFGACSAQPTYNTGAWSLCDKNSNSQNRTVQCTNTSGNQTRTITCQDSNGKTVPDSNCTSPKPVATESCTAQCSGTVPASTQSCTPAVTYQWNVGQFGACSAQPTYNTGAWSLCDKNSNSQNRTVQCTNTSGNQTRTITCQDSNGKTVPDSNCTSPKPVATESCTAQCSGTVPASTQSCTPAVTYQWNVGQFGACSAASLWSEWSSCSNLCDGGSQMRTCQNSTGEENRTVECISSAGTKVNDQFCTEPKPLAKQSCTVTCSGSSTQICNTQACPPVNNPDDFCWSMLNRVFGQSNVMCPREPM
jgi:uncharacterized lipoprotein YmbA